jgi:hypothetical protein
MTIKFAEPAMKENDMIYRMAISILCVTLLAACVPATSSSPSATQPVEQPTSTTAAPSPYPAPLATDAAGQPKNLTSYPYPPATEPNASNMMRGEVFVDKSELVPSKSNPEQYSLEISGSLPTPCNVLKFNVGSPDNQNRIQVELYSLIETDKMCAQVLEPFDTSIPLGSLKSGKYTVMLNDNQVGELVIP